MKGCEYHILMGDGRGERLKLELHIVWLVILLNQYPFPGRVFQHREVSDPPPTDHWLLHVRFIKWLESGSPDYLH